MLRGLIGRSDFLCVADSKLFVSETFLNIDRNQGRFIPSCLVLGEKWKIFKPRSKPPW
jgi:hypothetical protein